MPKPPPLELPDGARLRELDAANQRLQQLACELQARVQDCERELTETRAQAARLADLDQLTGLANRAAFTAELEVIAADERLAGRRLALFLLDLDHFKQINDTIGNEAGDALLQHVALRLFSCAASDDLVARLGGDEFVLLARIGEDDSDLDRLAAKLLDAVQEPVLYRDRPIDITCSIGIARFPEDGVTAADLQRHADLALDRAKKLRSAVTVYRPEMGLAYDARQTLGTELASALGSGQIEAWFQPIYDHAARRIVSAEALARWRHPTRGLLSPAQFLDLAEELGLMHELFACMLRSAAPAIRRWVGQGRLHSISLNLSPSQFTHGSMADDITTLLLELELPPQALMIEITEEVLMQEFGRASTQLERLSEHGIRIALDDFGVGYSNISYLRQLSFHTLKVDRSLIADVVSEPKVRSILGAIVALARSLELSLVAEGVETEAQSAQLALLGFRRQQGYFHGRPMPIAAFEQAISGSVCLSTLQLVSERSHRTEPGETSRVLAAR